jgi:hypothetical protein
MRVRKSFLCAYHFLLQLYPSDFRKRFAPEMLELAEAAAPTEWPLIFGDTSVAIVRCWVEAAAIRPTAMPAEPNGYLALGESRLTPFRLLQGFAGAIAIILGLCYVSSLEYWQLPSYPECKPISTKDALSRARTEIALGSNTKERLLFPRAVWDGIKTPSGRTFVQPELGFPAPRTHTTHYAGY